MTLAASEQAFARLLEMVTLLHGPQKDETLAAVYWSQMHGLAGLIVDGPRGARTPNAKARQSLKREVASRFADLMLTGEA